MSRLDRLAATLEEPFLVLNPTNVAYLTGFRSTNPALVVEPGGRATLYSDFRYAEAGRAVAGVEFVETRRDVAADLAGRLTGRLGFEADFVTYARWETLAGGGAELLPRRRVVEALRAVKDEAELDAVRRAAAITSEAYARLAAEPFLGRTEREVAHRLEAHMRDLGADGLAFPVIVAAGANGANPHAEPGDRTIEPGQTIVVDAGARLDGYCSDCTRTFATAPLADELKRAYEVCHAAQLAGLAAVRPGVTGVDADARAREVVAGAGLGERFGHGLGHGVGRDIHEAPTLSMLSEDTLAAGNVVTVEPGVYIPGVGGIRIEDLVVVRDGEPEILTPFTKDLLTVG
jgi:Xaa-Pro aminopeptidase